MDDVTWEAPGNGPWELETTHFSRPAARFSVAEVREQLGKKEGDVVTVHLTERKER